MFNQIVIEQNEIEALISYYEKIYNDNNHPKSELSLAQLDAVVKRQEQLKAMLK